jgi:prephenate dehydrogenase
MKNVAIVGVGLIGGSFGLALRASGFSGELVGVSSKGAIEAGLAAGVIDRAVSLSEAAASSDLMYLAQPVDRILTTIDQLAPLLRPGTLVTDAGSTKKAIVSKANEVLPPGSFLGGHPLAGKEQRGAAAGDANLFRNRPYVVTPAAASEAVSEFKEWLTKMGARIIEMSPEEHDATVAHSSHLPQMASTALALALSERPELPIAKVFGPGLVDMTRLALSSVDLWGPILATNKTQVISAIDTYIGSLHSLRDALQNDSLVKLFEIGSGWAKFLREPKTGT